MVSGCVMWCGHLEHLECGMKPLEGHVATSMMHAHTHTHRPGDTHSPTTTGRYDPRYEGKGRFNPPPS
eukprot:1643394-Prymnesium_polylepis.1